MDQRTKSVKTIIVLIGRCLISAFILLLSFYQPASANNAPGPWPVLMIISILLAPIGIVVTTVSGGYAAIELRKEFKDGWTVPLIFKIVGALILVPMILCLVAWVPIALWSLIRAIQLILWGIERRQDAERSAPFLRQSDAARLLWSGVTLLALTAAVVFFQLQMTAQVYSAQNFQQLQEQLKNLNNAV